MPSEGTVVVPVVWLAPLACAWCGSYLYGTAVSFCRSCDMPEELDGFSMGLSVMMEFRPRMLARVRAAVTGETRLHDRRRFEVWGWNVWYEH